MKDELKRHMATFGVRVGNPTRIKLVASGASGPDGPSLDSHRFGTTTWDVHNDHVLSGPITIRVLRGMPLVRFRHVIAHEFGHAAMAGSPGSARLGPRIIEGFAEALAVIHLEGQSDAENVQYAKMLLTNPDPVYGDGLRAVIGVVRQKGLAETLRALRKNRPDAVGLPIQ
ncbi:MAG: hypothetical protein ACT4P1_11320 [Sporichthyaceae bacterium]